MKTALRPHETLIREGNANLQKGWETVGGKLFLTNQRLVFESHKFNVQAGTTAIPLSTVRALRPVWTKFLGLIPMVPNSLAVQTSTGETYAFVLSSRAEWKSAIEKHLQTIKA